MSCNLKNLETGNIENTDKGRAFTGGLVKWFVDAGNDPLEQFLVKCLLFSGRFSDQIMQKKMIFGRNSEIRDVGKLCDKIMNFEEPSQNEKLRDSPKIDFSKNIKNRPFP